jgi:hypothetical protein
MRFAFIAAKKAEHTVPDPILDVMDLFFDSGEAFINILMMTGTLAYERDIPRGRWSVRLSLQI